jgi:hypothetical protein
LFPNLQQDIGSTVLDPQAECKKIQGVRIQHILASESNFDLVICSLCSETKSASRPWWFQYCTEYGWFQTYSDRHPLRSFRLDLQYYRNVCQKVFGVDALPKILRTNSEYGGLNEQVTNIIYSNGVEGS